MKLITSVFLSFLLFLFCFSPVSKASRGIKLISIKDNNGREVGLYNESYALVIGGIDYTGGWPSLSGVEEDISLVKDALESKGFNVVLVRNPNSLELENAFEEFIEKYGFKPNNRLLFYFAGHGHTVKPKYGGNELGYIVPVDAPNPFDDINKFRRVAMSMQRIEEYALSIDSKHALFVFDSCFSGSLFALSRAVPEHISYKTAKPVRQFITSGSADEKVPDTSIFRMLFVSALDGEGDLDGDDYITVSELSSFIFSNVVNYSKGAQHPQYGKIRNPYLDKGDFVFRIAQLEKTDDIDSVTDSLIEVEQHQPKVVGELLKKVEKLETLLSKVTPEANNVKELARDGSFILYDDGTVLDTKTNLMWWSESINLGVVRYAESKVHNFRGGNYSDWRLPLIRELKTIYEKKSKRTYRSIKFINLTKPRIISSDRRSQFVTSGGYDDFVYLNFKNGSEGLLSSHITGDFLLVRDYK